MKIKEEEKLSLTTEEGRTALFNKYIPLLYKIVNQWVGKLPLEFDDIVGYAQEGFVYSMNTYKSDTTQTFKQYAAWCMRNFILSGANEEGHTVKYSAYNQKKTKDAGGSTYIMRSIDMNWDSRENGPFETIAGIDEIPIDGTAEDAYREMHKFVVKNFSVRDCDMFFRTYGLFGKEAEKCKDIANSYNLSAASVTITNKKIIKAIQNDKDLMEILVKLLE